MEFIIIFGPAAVGKMAVGMELEKITPFKLFHNHMTIELVQPFFNYSTPKGRELVGEFRHRLFEEISKSELPGLIFTFVWAFDIPSEKDYIDSITRIFKDQGASVSYIELYASQKVRIERNTSKLRLEHKRSKRDLEWSQANLIDMDKNHELNTTTSFYYPDSYLKIDNSSLHPSKTAKQILEHLKL